MKAATPPNPYMVANAQGKQDLKTAVAQYGLNATNQKTPWGSLSYQNIGKWADGTPRFESTTTLDPRIQGIVDNGIGMMRDPFTMNNDATESRLMELGRQRLDPVLAARRGSTEQDAFNRGVRPGSEAYDRTMKGVTEGENDAYNQLLLQGHGQAVTEKQNERNQQINEILALINPNSGYINTPGTQMPQVDIAGMIQKNYEQTAANKNAQMSGLFGLGSAVLKAIPFTSDRRLKISIRRIGTLANGLPWYRFQYKAGGGWREGLMSDDVRKVKPWAVVVDSNGYDAVYYGEAMA